jgi:hypothetical protein
VKPSTEPGEVAMFMAGLVESLAIVCTIVVQISEK